jgi:hypothetical protein
MNFELEKELNSKRRKTTQAGLDRKKVNNPMKQLDLEKVDNLDIEIEETNKIIDYAFDSYKKRKFDKINEHYISRIPKPRPNIMIVYSKYQDIPTKIPKLMF